MDKALRLDIEKNRPIWGAHCKGTFPREFAFKPLPNGQRKRQRRHRQGSRLPNIKHQSGLYCIPLEKSELLRGTGYIRRLAQKPRRNFDLEERIKENIRSNSTTVPGLLKALEEVVIERKEEAEETKQESESNRIYAFRGSVTKEQIRKARSYPISWILGTKKLVLCPFHNDAVPSLSIDHERGLWYCFGCSRSGNVIQLVMKLEGLDFRDAVRRHIDPG